MTITDYLLNGALIFAIVRQLRGRRLEGLSLYLPLGIVAFVCTKYLHSVPTGGNSLGLVGVGVALGLTLGILCGLYTLVYRDGDGVAFARATTVAAALWILGVGARLGFELYAEHGGGPSLARFSAAHALSMQSWVAALILMALSEVVSRTLVLIVRARRLGAGAGGAIISQT
ncbi:MAG TPA: hypothetical protein VFA97_04250 [Gaiellaceae bacterium]|nr:hypothetical protein [Gaiellaceae bacterium]